MQKESVSYFISTSSSWKNRYWRKIIASYLKKIRQDTFTYGPAIMQTASSAASVLIEYFITVVSTLEWSSDQGPHFCNELMITLASSLGASHSFSTVYVPWSNGVEELVCKETLRALHALSTYMRVHEMEWLKEVHSIKSVINSSLAKRLGYQVLTKVHTRMRKGNLLIVALTVDQNRGVKDIDEVV